MPAYHTSEVPDLELQVLVCHGLNVESDGCRKSDRVNTLLLVRLWKHMHG